jgi:excisionase family DNA binding protein
LDEEKQALNIHEAAAFLGAHPQTVRKLARKNEIPSFKVGQDWRFHREALQRWVDTHHLRSRAAKVLVVDDERTVRNSVRLLLEGAGYGVSVAADGAEALARMAAEPADVVLLDLQMPVMDGPTTLQRLRQEHRNVPVIIVTAYPDGELMSRALEHGPLLVLPKPVGKQPLLEGILTALRVPKSRAG